MHVQIRQGMNRRVARNNQAYRILLKDCRYVNNFQSLTTRYQFLVSASKDKVIVSQDHRANQVIDDTVMKGHIQARSFVVALTLCYIKWGELDIWNIAQANRNFC